MRDAGGKEWMTAQLSKNWEKVGRYSDRRSAVG